MAAVEAIVNQEALAGDWMRQAACRGLTYLFFPTPAERPQAPRASRSDRTRGVRQLFRPIELSRVRS